MDHTTLAEDFAHVPPHQRADVARFYLDQGWAGWADVESALASRIPVCVERLEKHEI